MSKLTTLQLAAHIQLSNREADRRRHESRPRTQVRKGQIYRLLQEAPGGLLDKLADEQLTAADGLAILRGLYPDKGFTDDGIRRAVNRRRNELGREKLADDWQVELMTLGSSAQSLNL